MAPGDSSSRVANVAATSAPVRASCYGSWRCSALADAVKGGIPGEQLHVVFAGGIHNARSAAMAATMAAPLAQLGVRVGVLVGTGYLFTEEAVSSGAIVHTFQQEAVSCTRTVLLEVGPRPRDPLRRHGLLRHVPRCPQTIARRREERGRSARRARNAQSRPAPDGLERNRPRRTGIEPDRTTDLRFRES